MTRLEELYERIKDYDDVDGAVETIKLLEAEATPDWLPTLHEWLAEPDDFFLRECTAPAVIKLEGIACLPRLLHAMRLGTSEGHDNDCLQVYIADLARLEPKAASAYLMKLAASSDESDREDAAWLLGYLYKSVEPAALVALSRDASPSVRDAACGSLCSYKDREDVFEALVSRLSDGEESVRISAVNALGYYGDSWALPLLEPLQNTGSPRMRDSLEYSLRRLHESTGHNPPP